MDEVHHFVLDNSGFVILSCTNIIPKVPSQSPSPRASVDVVVSFACLA